MTTLEIVRALLSASSPLTALVAARIYPGVVPQGAPFPAVVLRVVDEVPENSLTPSVSERLMRARLQVDCYAPTYRAARELFDEVDVVLGALASNSNTSELLMVRDLYDDESQMHRVTADFEVSR